MRLLDSPRADFKLAIFATARVIQALIEEEPRCRRKEVRQLRCRRGPGLALHRRLRHHLLEARCPPKLPGRDRHDNGGKKHGKGDVDAS